MQKQEEKNERKTQMDQKPKLVQAKTYQSMAIDTSIKRWENTEEIKVSKKLDRKEEKKSEW